MRLHNIALMTSLSIEDENVISTYLYSIKSPHFSCVAAKAALAGESIDFVVAGDLRCGNLDAKIVQSLQRFRPAEQAKYASIAVLFPATPALSESDFDRFLWTRLQAPHNLDRKSFPWDPTVSQNPASPDFGFSIGGQAFFVIGMHPAASRISRRMPFPAIAFNTHAQFRRLRANGSYGRVQTATRAREIALQGRLNPMLADHGVTSEARQYSGRQQTAQWTCPFQSAGQRGETA